RCAGRCGRPRAGAAPRCRAPACAPAPGGVPARRRWDWFASARPRGARRLPGLAADALLGVLDALRLVGLGRPELAQRGRGLAEELAVGALECDRHLAVDPGGEPRRQPEVDRVGVAEGQDDDAAAGLGAVADAAHLERAREALAHPAD